MNIDPKNPKWADRDRFVLSKGHCCPSLYAVLALKGYFDWDELTKLRQVGAMLQGHPDMKGLPVSTRAQARLDRAFRQRAEWLLPQSSTTRTIGHILPWRRRG